jgi:hypothetical protein
LTIETQQYYYRVLAHRTYQYAMCLYKELRYKEGGKRDPSLTWHKVDAWLRRAIERYTFIKKEKQFVFIDIIIKITLCRGYANNKNKKLLTAEKILECAN